MIYNEWIATHTTGRHVFHGRVLMMDDTHVTVRVGERVDGRWVEVDDIDDGPAAMDLDLLRADLPAYAFPRMAVCVIIEDDVIVDARDARDGCRCPTRKPS